MAAALKLEILAYAPTAFFHCRHCEMVWDATGFSRGVREEQLRSSLPAEMRSEYARVADWVRRLAASHGERIALDLVDAASVRGFWKSLRHGVHRYPAVIVDGQVTSDLEAAEAAVVRRLSTAAQA